MRMWPSEIESPRLEASLVHERPSDLRKAIMSYLRALGHSLPGGRSRISAIIHGLRPVDFWRHPIATVRRWKWAHRSPTPADFDQMASSEFEAYIRDIGFDAHVSAAMAESESIVKQARSDGQIPVGEREPER